MNKSNSPKKIFVLLSRIPFPFEKGDKLRAYHQIKLLAEYYEIYLCAISDSNSIHNDAKQALSPYCKEINFIHVSWWQKVLGVCQAFFSGNPLQVGLFYNFLAKQKVDKWVRIVNPDLVFVQLLRVAPYFQSTDIPKVLDFQDALSMGVFRQIKSINFFLKPIYYLEYQLLKCYEKRLLKDFSHTSIISSVDQKWIDSENKHEIQLILNGVDFDYYQPIDCEKDITLLFTGNMGYLPNVDAAEFLVNQIMPLVWKQFPMAKVAIAGANPHSRVKSLASEKVLVTGFVQDLRDFYSRSQIFIAPMRLGSGLQNKLLEAMAMKIPSITTTLANNALNGTQNVNIMICDSPKEFADTISKLLSDELLREAMSTAALAFVQTNYNWKEQVSKLHQLIEKSYE